MRKTGKKAPLTTIEKQTKTDALRGKQSTHANRTTNQDHQQIQPVAPQKSQPVKRQEGLRTNDSMTPEPPGMWMSGREYSEKEGW
jgi:hypothetical protein